MKKYAIFEVINKRATQVSAAMYDAEAREFYQRLAKADDNREPQHAESRLEIRQVTA